jgi:hypothetical protein
VAIKYRVYANDYAGGPVDYSTPVATVTGTTWTPDPIPTGSDVTFAVRAFDDVTGLEERNVSARLRLATGPAGEDLTGLPPAPPFAWAAPHGAGGVSVTWGQPVAGPRPASYRVYGGTPDVDYGAPLATVAHREGLPVRRAVVAGLTPGEPYRFAVRSVNAAGESPSSPGCAATPVGSGPEAPVALSGAAGWADPA